MTFLLYFFAGALLAAAISTIIFKSRQHASQAALGERLQNREIQITELKQREATLSRELSESQSLNVKLEALSAETRKHVEEKLKLLQEAETKLSQSFKALSAEALQNSSQSFLHLAKATLEKYQEGAKADLEKRGTAIHELVKPVKESLDKVDHKIQEMEKLRSGAYEGLKEQIKSLMDSQHHLRAETANLVKALRSPVVRGRWGEIQLKKVVEMAGMVQHCDFAEQAGVTTEEGRLRPDLIVHLPGKKNIVVDSKVPLTAFLEAVETGDDQVRQEKQREHTRHIREHMNALGAKKYWDQFQPTPEFVVLFLPGENFFSAALQQDPSLIELGVEQKVIIATPTTLIALLRAVHYGWRQESLAENAKKISDLGSELYNRLGTINQYFADLGKSLGKSVEAYNSAMRSLESRVFVSARKFKELGTSNEELTPLEPIDKTPLAVPELSPSADCEDESALPPSN